MMKTKTTLLKEFSLGQRAFLSFLLTLIFTIFSAQNNGDYKSIGNGNWTNNNVWQVYDGVTESWKNAGPGVFPGYDALTAGTTKSYSVTISSNTTITVTTVTAYYFGDLNVNGKLELAYGNSGTGDWSLPATNNLTISGSGAEVIFMDMKTVF